MGSQGLPGAECEQAGLWVRKTFASGEGIPDGRSSGSARPVPGYQEVLRPWAKGKELMQMV